MFYFALIILHLYTQPTIAVQAVLRFAFTWRILNLFDRCIQAGSNAFHHCNKHSSQDNSHNVDLGIDLVDNIDQGVYNKVNK